MKFSQYFGVLMAPVPLTQQSLSDLTVLTVTVILDLFVFTLSIELLVLLKKLLATNNNQQSTK